MYNLSIFDIQVGKYGKVTGFKTYIREANSRKSVTFQLWKPADLNNHNYELVAEYSFTVNGEGLNEVRNLGNKCFCISFFERRKIKLFSALLEFC